MLNRILKKSKDLAAINSKGNCEKQGNGLCLVIIRAKPGLSGIITLKTAMILLRSAYSWPFRNQERTLIRWSISLMVL